MALAESDARLRMAQEAVGIGAWEWPGADRSLNCSAKMLEIFGFDPAQTAPDLDAVLERLHVEDRLRLRDSLREVRRSGGFSGEYRLLRSGAGGAVETVWVAVRARVITSMGVARPVVMGIVYDITARKRADELAALMAHEVEHRAKNALAVVSSLLRMTKADSAEELAEAMGGRVRALSQTMALLGRGRWKGTGLREIVMSELAPFEDDGSEESCIEVSGPPVVVDVDAAQPLAMALHELATNAAKYGALSVPTGRVRVEWRIEAGRVHLVWRESGGPPIAGAPAGSGFGSKLIAMLFEGQLGGVVVKRWDPSGLICEMSFPIPPQP
jgi:PAS domain S-box-containing protein